MNMTMLRTLFLLLKTSLMSSQIGLCGSYEVFCASLLGDLSGFSLWKMKTKRQRTVNRPFCKYVIFSNRFIWTKTGRQQLWPERFHSSQMFSAELRIVLRDMQHQLLPPILAHSTLKFILRMSPQASQAREARIQEIIMKITLQWTRRKISCSHLHLLKSLWREHRKISLSSNHQDIQLSLRDPLSI